MSKKSFLKYLFSIDTKSSSRIIIYFCGIKIKFVNPEIKKLTQKYKEMDITKIPKAEGILRKIQLANLKIMLLFDKLCKENNLKYWLDFGNLLGAVRHGGFIPWDDDVDFGMPRDDYEKFIELFINGIPKYNDLYIEFENNGKDCCFIKIKHKNLPSISLDIFPYDFYYKKIDTDEQIKITKKMCDKRNSLKYKLLKPFYKNNPNGMRKRFFEIRDNIILNGHKPKIEDCPPLFYGLDYPHPYNNYFFDYDKIFPLKTIKYENYDLPCPNDEIFVLKQIFNDYMTLPKVCYPGHIDVNSYDESFLDKFIGEK